MKQTYWLMEDKLTQQIIKVLKKAASIKDKFEPICNTSLRYYGKKLQYRMCMKCYPDQDNSYKCTKLCKLCCR